MHSLKKALALFLVLALIVQVLPLSIFAVDTAARGLVNQEQKNAASKEQAAKENESKQQSQTVVGEMTDLRSETEKHFRLDDGSFIAVDYGMPVHFTEDGGNHWKEIDNTLVLSQNSAAGKQQAMWQNVGESSYTAKNGNNSHSFASDLRSGTLFTAQTDSYGLRMSLTDSNTQGETLASVDEAKDAKIAEQVKDGKAIESTEAVKVTEASASVEETEASVCVEETEASAPVEETETVASVEETEAAVSVEETEAVASVEETEDAASAEETEDAASAEETETAASVEETAAGASVEETEAVAVETKLVEVSEQFAFDSVAEISYPVRTAAGSDDVSVKNPVASMIQNHFPGLNTGNKNEAVSLEEQIMPKKLEADVLYRNVYQDVDLRYALYGYNVKETIVVNRARQDYVFPFYLDLKDLTPVQMEDGSVELRNQKGEVVYLIPAPYMVDANGAESFDVAYKLAQSKSGAWQLTVVADEKWINDKERAFPVEIDPTLIDEIHSSEILKRCVADGGDPEKYISKTNLVCGYHPTYGQTEVYFKTASLPDVPRGSEVVNAFFAFYQNDYRPSNTTGKVNLSVKPCLSAISNYNTLTWQGRPSLGPTLDYTVAGNNTIAKYHKWDVTSEAKKWYSNPATNYGLAMTSDANSSNKRRVWFSYDTVLFFVTYRDMTGIEGYYTYQTADVGRAGMAYISDYTGALTTVTPLVSYASTVNPFTLSIIYNSSYFKGEGPDYVSVPQNLGYSMTMGSGMKLSIMQTVAYVDLQDESQDSGTTRYIKYTDGDGTEHYFAKDLSKDSTGAYYYDEDGLGLKITEYVSGYFRMEDDKGNKMYFVHGFLTIIMDANGNSINVYYSDVNGNWEDPGYPNSTHKRIHHITQKNNGQAPITVATFAYATVAERKNTLTSVTDAAGNVYTFNYGCHKLRSIDRNGSAYAEFIHPYNSTTNRFVNPVIGLKDSVNNYAIGFNYTDSRIANYFEVANATNATGTSKDNGKWTSFSIGNGSRGAGVTISRVLGEKTIYTDWGIDHNPDTAADNISTTYLFDNAGRTVNAYSTDSSSEIIGASNAVYTNLSGTDRRKNRTLTASGIGVSAMSHLLNGSFERTDFAWSFSNVPAGCAAKISNISSTDYSELVRTGSMALKLWGGDDYSSGTFIASHTTMGNLYVGQTYTASVYVNTSKATIDANAGEIYLQVTDGKGNTYTGESMRYKTDGNIDGGWNRISVTFTVRKECPHTVNICSNGVKGTTYFDDCQIETGSAPSNYNLLQNGNLNYWGDTWKNEGNNSAAFSDQVKGVGTGAYSMQIAGDPEAVKYIYQTVPISQPGTQTYVLSGWAKANAVPCSIGKGENETDEAFRERFAKNTEKSFGLRAVLTYTDNTKEYFYAPFNPDVTDWQYVSLAIVPKNPTKQISTMQVYCVYEKNANMAYFDNLSLVKSVAQTMKYDEDGNLVSVQSSGTKAETTTYENGNLIQVVTGGSGTFNYTYDNKHNLTDAANSVVKEHYSYDAAGNLIETKLTKKDGNFEPSETIYSNRSYTNSGNLVESVTDANGSKVKYTYEDNASKMLGLPTLTTDPNNTSVVTHYDSEGHVTNAWISGKVAVPRAYNEKGQLSEMHRGGHYDNETYLQKYRFTYNDFGQTTKITMGYNNEYTLLQNSFSVGGLLTESKLGNGAYVRYTYDKFGRIIQSNTSSNDSYSYTYTGDGQLYELNDVAGGLRYRYSYDTLGRLIGSTMKSGNTVSLQTQHQYDDCSRLSKQIWALPGRTYQESYTYDKTNGRLTKKSIKFPNGNTSSISMTYDNLSRISAITTPVSVIYYNYAAAQNRTGGGTTGRVSAMSVNPRKTGDGVLGTLGYNYQYDALGNITQILEDHPDGRKETTTYSYDVQSQMTQAASSLNGTWMYTYDPFGNIHTKIHVNKTENETINYTYGDAAWIDLLTAVNGKMIAYEGQTYKSSDNTVSGTAKSGNPVSYYNGTRWAFSWKNGRELSTATKSNMTLSFDYDVNGIRTYKDVNGVRHDYTYASGQLLRETYTKNGTSYTLDFFYDTNGRPYRLYCSKAGKTNSEKAYYYLLNLQGDVVGLTDTNGKLVASYIYDPFGKILSAENATSAKVADLNPLRYRGYYYDSETKFYYLQSRYYDPALGRFINADSYASTGQGFLGYNMFAYCNNNPVNSEDQNGDRPLNVNIEMTDGGGGKKSKKKRYKNIIAAVDDFVKNTAGKSGQYVANIYCHIGNLKPEYVKNGDEQYSPSELMYLINNYEQCYEFYYTMEMRSVDECIENPTYTIKSSSNMLYGQWCGPTVPFCDKGATAFVCKVNDPSNSDWFESYVRAINEMAAFNSNIGFIVNCDNSYECVSEGNPFVGWVQNTP